MGLAAGGEG
ncbi:hypothetical protein YPPY94_4542, partial [Yersinia pestis PY-94]